jgi:thiol-disulfide isomerase/thioredoxin
MMKAAIWCLAMLLCIKTGAQIYRPGDHYPGFTSIEVLNHSSDTLNMTDFKGKHIILDFWNLFCLSCIEAFPKLESLQKKFKDLIQIILVNRETKEATQEFFAKRKKIKLPDLPLVTEDKILRNQFPRLAVPFTVWIDSTGKVEYYTDGFNLTEENLRTFLSGKRLKIKEYERSKPRKSLFDTAYSNVIDYYSYFSRCINGVQIIDGDSEKHERIGKSCSSIENLFQIAYNEGGKYVFQKPGRTILEVKEPARFKYPMDKSQYDKWREKNAYNYYLQVPRNKGYNKYELMKKDLQAYFGVKATIEYRNLLSWVLVETGTKELPVSKGGKTWFNFYKESIKKIALDSIRSVRNYPLKGFASILGTVLEYYTNEPFADATSFAGNIDIDIVGKTIDDSDMEGLRKELNKQGLDLIKVMWLHRVLVLKE